MESGMQLHATVICFSVLISCCHLANCGSVDTFKNALDELANDVLGVQAYEVYIILLFSVYRKPCTDISVVSSIIF